MGKKERRGDKALRKEPVPQGGSSEGRKVLHTGKHLKDGDRGGHFRTSKESAATGVWKANWRDFCTQISAYQHSPA